MDGTYGNVFKPKPGGMSPMSPMSPNTPISGGGQYKTNVSRQKTKKWVEAKVQNYDGDDWGNEYDEEPEEPPLPPPPMRPMGPRSPASPPLPMGQQPPPMSRPFQTPASPALSPPMRTSSGALPLHIQTQQPPFSRGPPETDSRPSSLASSATGERLSSLQSPNVASPSVQGHPHGLVSPTSQAQRRQSPAPQSAGPVPARFPPRKSSMGQQDSPDFEALRQSGSSGSRPDSNPKPWMEARPASPGSAKSPGTPSKQLPFIRPSDIYKRMEEQQEKDRRSMESGRFSSDSAGGRIESPSRAQPEQADTGRRMSPSIDDGADSSRSVRPSLAPVAERKSEYGIEGLIASYETSEPEPTPPIPPRAGFMDPEVSLSQKEPPVSHEQEEPQPEDDLRRFSTSPKLPDLARMSTFGMDFFSGSSAFLSDAPPMPDIHDGPGDKQPAGDGNDPAGLQTLAEENEDVAETPAPVGPTIAESVSEMPRSAVTSLGAQSSPANSGLPSPVPEQPPALVEGPEPTTAAASHKATAGIVDPIGEQPGAPAEPALEQTSLLIDEDVSSRPSPSGNTSTQSYQAVGLGGPVAVTGHSGISLPTEASESGEDSASSASSASASMEQMSGAAPNTSRPASDVKTSMEIPSGPARPISPNSLPPLRTTSPLTSASKTEAGQPFSAAQDELSHEQPAQDSPRTPASSLTPATVRSDITPTAPLNPQRASVAPVDLPPPNLERINTMSTVTTISPAKESDKLRDEIMKSLSPVVPGSDFGDLSVGDASKDAGSRAARESSYLPDLYGDYWASSDDKAEQDIPAIAEEEAATSSESSEGSNPINDEPSNPAVATAREAPGANPSAETMPRSGGGPEADLRRRFSWEAGSERVNVDSAGSESPVQPKSLGVASPTAAIAQPTQTAQEPGQTSPALSQGPSQGAAGGELGGTALAVNSNPTGMTHQVSQASTLPPQSELAPPLEPPSPVSVVSDRRGTPGNEARRLSLAEEKTLAEQSGIPLFPVPAPEQHPALSQTSLPSPHAAAHAIAAKKDSVNIIPFRQITGMQTAGERIQLFNETREQFAETDQGLGDWLTLLTTQHPEYANSTSQFKDPLAPIVGGDAAPGMVPQGAQQQQQQPYYQQYLSASSGNLVLTPGQRPASNLPTPPQQYGTSGFGHSGNQVGAKSKVLLMAAGKAGKGLLSKGKSKLRGSGEKDTYDPDPSPPSSPPQGQRRWSWGITQTFSNTFSGGRSSSASAQAGGSVAQRASLTGGPLLSRHQQFQRDPQNLPRQHPQLTQLHPRSPLLLPVGAGAVAYPSSSSSPINPPFAGHHHRQPSSPLAAAPLSLSHTPPPPPAHGRSNSNIGVGSGNASCDPPVSRRRDSQAELVSPVSETFSSRPTPAPSKAELADRLRIPPPIDRQAVVPIESNQPASNSALPVPAPAPEPQTQLHLRDQAPTNMATFAQQNPNLGQPGNLPSRGYQQQPQQQQQGYQMQQHHQQQGYPMQQRQQSYPAQQQGYPAQQRQQVYPTQHQQSYPTLQQQGQLAQHQQQFQQQPQQQPQQQQPQQQNLQTNSESPHRQSSFVGLPPIRRTSTFGVNSVLNSEEGSQDGGDTSSNPSSYQPATPQMQQGGQATAGQAAAPQQFNAAPAAGGPFIPGAYMPAQNSANSHYYPPYNQQLANAAPAGQQPPMQGGQPMPQAQQRGFAGPVSHPQVMLNGGPQQQQMVQGQQQPMQQGMQPQQGALAQNTGNPIRLPPQGAWNLQESHLTQPLLPANRHRTSPTGSPEQPFYGFDKETGVPSTGDMAPQRQQTPEVPAQTGQAPSSPPQGQQQSSPLARTSLGNAPASPARSSQHGRVPSAAGSGNFPPPGAAAIANEGGARRSSGLLSGLRDRFSAQATAERRSSAGGPRLQEVSQPTGVQPTGFQPSGVQPAGVQPTGTQPAGTQPAGTQPADVQPAGVQPVGVQPDAASESSITTEELREREHRRSLLGARGSAQPSGGAPADVLAGSRDSVVAHSPPTPLDQRMQPWGPPQAQQPAQPEKKRTFFGGGGSNAAAPQSNLGRPELSRASTATNITTEQGPPGGPMGPPKKRFSGFPLFNRHTNQDQGQKPPGSSHSARPSMQSQPGQPPFAPSQLQQQQQPGVAPGQERPSTSSRPFTAGGPSQVPPPQAGAAAGEERGRKPASFFSGIFGNRSGSKPRPQAAPAPTQQGQQPQGAQFQGQQNQQYQQQYRMQQQQQQGQGQGQQVGAKLMAPGQYAPYAGQPQPGQPQAGQTQYAPRIAPGGQQFTSLQGQAPGQRPGLATQNSLQNMQLQQQQQQSGAPAGQQPMNRMAGQPAPGPQGQFQPSAQQPGVATGQQQLNRVPLQSGMNPQGQPQSLVRLPVQGQAQQQPGQPGLQGAVGPGQLPSQAAQQGGQQPAQTTQQSNGAPLHQHPLQSNAIGQLSNDSVQDEASGQSSPPAENGSPRLASQQTAASIDEQSRPQSASPVSLKQVGSAQLVQNIPPQRFAQPSSPTPPPQSPTQQSIQLSPQRSDAVLSQASGEQGTPSVSAAPASFQNSIQSSPVISGAEVPKRVALQDGPQQPGTPLSQTTMMQPPMQNLPSPSVSPAPQLGQQPPPTSSTPQPSNQGPTILPGMPGGSPAPQPIRIASGQQGGQQQAGTQQLADLPPVSWDQNRTATNASGPMQPPGQQNMAGQQGMGRPLQQTNTMMSNGPPKERTSTMSKFFKSKPAAQTGPAQQKPEKAKSTLFGLRKPKQQQPPPLQGGPQYGPPQSQMGQQNPAQMQQQQGKPGPQTQPGQTQPGQPQPGQPQPGPHIQYQHQRQQIPNSTTPQPNQGPLAQRPGPQQPPNPGQAPSAGQPQQQNQAATAQPWQTTGQFRPSQPGQVGAPGQGGPQQQRQPSNQWPGAQGGPQGGPQPQRQPTNQWPGAQQGQQYAQVPIPRGYGIVHSEGRVDPAPVAYYVGPDGQYQRVQMGPQGQQQQQQPWIRQVSAGLPPNQQRPDGAPGAAPATQAVPQPQPPSQVLNNLVAAPAAAPAAQGEQGQLAEPQPSLDSQTPQQHTRESSIAQVTSAEELQLTSVDVPKPLVLGPKPQPTVAPNVALPQSKFQVPIVSNESQIQQSGEERTPAPITTNQQSNIQHPQILQPGSPQSYPLPNSTFSPVNPSVANLPNPPLPQGLAPASLGQEADPNIRRRDVSGASQDRSTSPSVQKPPSPAPGAVNGTGVHLVGRSPIPSPSPQITPDRNVSPEPAQALPPNIMASQSRQTVSPDLSSASTPPNMSISVPLANQHSEENIYDATPRTIPPARQVQPAAGTESTAPTAEVTEPKAAGPSHEIVEHIKAEETKPATLAAPAPIVPAAAAAAQNEVAVASGSEGATTPPKPAAPDMFEEARRKMMLREQEEKIPVFPTEPDMSAGAAEEAARRRHEEEHPQMSATSYPGQEWNPYEHWADDGEDE